MLLEVVSFLTCANPIALRALFSVQAVITAASLVRMGLKNALYYIRTVYSGLAHVSNDRYWVHLGCVDTKNKAWKSLRGLSKVDCVTDTIDSWRLRSFPRSISSRAAIEMRACVCDTDNCNSHTKSRAINEEPNASRLLMTSYYPITLALLIVVNAQLTIMVN